MSKYINANKLIKSVDNYQEGARAALNLIDGHANYYNGKIDACKDIKRFITSLQQEQPESGCSEKPNTLQEQPEVDIDEEIDKFIFAPFQNFDRVSGHCLVDMGDGKEWVPVYDWKITTYKRADAHFLRKFARHFYKLGLNARKEE